MRCSIILLTTLAGCAPPPPTFEEVVEISHREATQVVRACRDFDSDVYNLWFDFYLDEALRGRPIESAYKDLDLACPVPDDASCEACFFTIVESAYEVVAFVQ